MASPNQRFDRSATQMAASFPHTQVTHLREPRQLAAQEFLRVLGTMRNDKVLEEFTGKMPKDRLITFTQTASADSTPVVGPGGDVGPKTPGPTKNQIHQQHFNR